MVQNQLHLHKHNNKGEYKMINRLNIKLEEIRNQKEQVMANFHALSGAEQVLVQLIEEMKAEEVEVAE